MPYDNKPHWTIKFKPVTSRAERRRNAKASRSIECVLLRGDHIKAPLAKFKTLAQIHPNKKADEIEQSRFWRSVIESFAAISPELVDAETMEGLFKKILAQVPYVEPAVSAPVLDDELARPIKRAKLSDLRGTPESPSLWAQFRRKAQEIESSEQPTVPPLRFPPELFSRGRQVALRAMVKKIVSEG